MIRRSLILGSASLLVASLALADAHVEEKTQMHLNGMIGGIANAFGGKATHEGQISTTSVHGNRKMRRTDSSGELVDLSEEKIYHLDFDRKTYRVTTFEEMRKQFEQQRSRADKSSSGDKKGDGPEYDVDFDVHETGRKEVINSYKTHEVIVTVTIHEKGRKLEQSGGSVLTADMWMGPRIPALHDLANFDQRYFEKLYGKSFGGADMAQMAMAMASNPAFGKAMKAFSDKRSSFDGTPIRTTMSFDMVTGTDQPKDADKSSSDSGDASSVVAGLMSRMHRRNASEDANSQPNHNRFFDSTNEILQASDSASAADVAIPADFHQR